MNTWRRLAECFEASIVSKLTLSRPRPRSTPHPETSVRLFLVIEVLVKENLEALLNLYPKETLTSGC